MNRKIKRQIRVRRRIRLMSNRPRLTIFRSNKYLTAQVIDDLKGQTLAFVSEKTIKTDKKATGIEIAKLVGLEMAKAALAKKIKKVVFDKGSYAYHGRVKAFADAAREGGLQF